MLRLNSFQAIYLHRDFVDMRKCINGLSAIVQGEMGLDPFANTLFVFCNKRRNRFKMIYWNRTGFALWMKKLDKGYFRWPIRGQESVVTLTSRQLSLLLDGIDILKLKPHKAISYERVL